MLALVVETNRVCQGDRTSRGYRSALGAMQEASSCIRATHLGGELYLRETVP